MYNYNKKSETIQTTKQYCGSCRYFDPLYYDKEINTNIGECTWIHSNWMNLPYPLTFIQPNSKYIRVSELEGISCPCYLKKEELLSA